MAVSPDFEALLEEILELHNRKNADYAGSSNPFANFEWVANFTKLSVDKVIEVMIGIKYARLDVLLDAEGEPNFESVEDTLLDVAVYSLIRLAYRRMLSREASEDAFDELNEAMAQVNSTYVPRPKLTPTAAAAIEEFMEGADRPMWDVDGTVKEFAEAGRAVIDIMVSGESIYTELDTELVTQAEKFARLWDAANPEQPADPWGLPPESLGDIVGSTLGWEIAGISDDPTPEGAVNGLWPPSDYLEGLNAEQRVSVEELIEAVEAEGWIVTVEADCN